MLAYKKYVIITDPNRLTLKGLPFKPGQRVEVVMIAEEDQKAHLSDVKALLKQTQRLPEARSISEAEIAAEIAAYRAEP